jgi:hypothetical protein
VDEIDDNNHHLNGSNLSLNSLRKLQKSIHMNLYFISEMNSPPSTTTVNHANV